MLDRANSLSLRAIGIDHPTRRTRHDGMKPCGHAVDVGLVMLAPEFGDGRTITVNRQALLRRDLDRRDPRSRPPGAKGANRAGLPLPRNNAHDNRGERGIRRKYVRDYSLELGSYSTAAIPKAITPASSRFFAFSDSRALGLHGWPPALMADP